MYLARTSDQEFIINLGDITFNFGKLGINKITHPISFTHSQTVPITTDWVSPYNVGTVTNGQPDNNHAASGGNHGTNGSGGYPTASSIASFLKIDDTDVIKDSQLKWFKKAELTTINDVTCKANIDLSNGEKLRTDFRETVKYTFEHNHIQVETEIEAYQDIYLYWYMGLQATRGGFDGDMYFNHDEFNTGITPISNARIDSGNKAQSPNMQRLTMRKNNNVMHVYMDKDYGLGYSQIRDNDPIAYLNQVTETNSGKLYYHLVKNGNTLIIPKGSKVKYRGGYIFGKNKAVNATTVTHFTENGVKKAYVDFKTISTETLPHSQVEKSYNCTFNGNSIRSTSPNAYAKVII